MKILKRTITITLWTVLGLYLLILALVQVPKVQEFLAQEAASALSDKLGAKVAIGKVNLGLLNRLIVDDIAIWDKRQKPCLEASRVAVNVDFVPLSEGKIVVSSAQIFGFKGTVYTMAGEKASNVKFIVDALQGDTTKASEPLTLKIKSLVIRHGALKYDDFNKPHNLKRFSLSHLDLKEISSHIVFQVDKSERMEAQLKSLSFEEASGLDVKNVAFRLKVTPDTVEANNVEIRINKSRILIDRLLSAGRSTNQSQTIDRTELICRSFRGEVYPADFQAFMPQLKSLNEAVRVDGGFHKKGKSLDLERLDIATGNDNLRLLMSAHYSTDEPKPFELDIEKCHAASPFALDVMRALGLRLAAQESGTIEALGSVDLSLRAKGNIRHSGFMGKVLTKCGQADFSGSVNNSSVALKLALKNADLGTLLADKDLGKATLLADINARFKQNVLDFEAKNYDIKPLSANVKGRIDGLEYKGYGYSDIALLADMSHSLVKAKVESQDINARFSADMALGLNGQKPLKVSLTADRLCPKALNLSDLWGSAAFSFSLNGEVSGISSPKPDISASLRNFEMDIDSLQYTVQEADVDIKKESVNLSGDFGSLALTGHYDLSRLQQSIVNIIAEKLPTLPSLPAVRKQQANEFAFDMDISDARPLRYLLHVPLALKEPLTLSGSLSDRQKSVELYATGKDAVYQDLHFKDFALNVATSESSLQTSAALTRLLPSGNKQHFSLTSFAKDNKISTSLGLDFNQKHPISGTLNAEVSLRKNLLGTSTAYVDVLPSEIMVNDTAWSVHPSEITYEKDRLEVKNFSIAHLNQHLSISGRAGKEDEDSLVASLQEINVAYILDLVDFDAVTFSGKASGRATVSGAMSSQPKAEAALDVSDFRFQEGRMGQLHALARWNNSLGQIDISAVAKESAKQRTLINGYVSPKRNYIDLGIKAEDTNIEFMHSFCSSFMSRINARANGEVRLWGDLSYVNLTGLLLASGKVDIAPLKTTYTLNNDSIRLIQNEIIFPRDTIRDRNNNIAILSGALHHKYLTRLTYDLNIETRNFLCFDRTYYGDETFRGTVYGTGTCSITGRKGSTVFDISLTPDKRSFIEYNASDEGRVSQKEFLTWLNPNDSTAVEEAKKRAQEQEIPSDMRINLALNATEDFTLGVLMDSQSGDVIRLKGNGGIKADYFNKGSFKMFGTYLVSSGTYSLTIQNLMRRIFQFQAGSTIVFGGDPYQATLNMKALYPINSVSLSDLQLGKSFTTSNVHVDCLMNLTGTAEKPKVDFDIDLPTVSTDAKQMVRQLINSEEEMNQQVIYLLSIGRFYNQTGNNASASASQPSQASLAMQSLLSGTLSEQINNVITGLTHNENWHFGANISPGDEGLSNAEYEGLLSGRLLNNRLLINGQFGYRDNPNATSTFIGDFDIKYLLKPNGNVAVKIYNQTNDRYFTKSSLNTQGIALILKKDFNSWLQLFGSKKSASKKTTPKKTKKKKRQKAPAAR